MYLANLVLLEDCSELREILHWDIQQNFPYINVISSTNFQESLSILENNKIEFVLTDYYLSGHTGLELYAKFSKKSKFIIMSGDGNVKANLKGFDITFIEKPFNSEILTKTILEEVNRLGLIERPQEVI